MGDISKEEEEISYKRPIAELLTVSLIEVALLLIFTIVLIYFAIQTIKHTRNGN